MNVFNRAGREYRLRLRPKSIGLPQRRRALLRGCKSSTRGSLQGMSTLCVFKCEHGKDVVDLVASFTLWHDFCDASLHRSAPAEQTACNRKRVLQVVEPALWSEFQKQGACSIGTDAQKQLRCLAWRERRGVDSGGHERTLDRRTNLDTRYPHRSRPREHERVGQAALCADASTRPFRARRTVIFGSG